MTKISKEQRQAIRWIADMLIIGEIRRDVFSKIPALKGRLKELDRHLEKSWPEPFRAWQVLQEERQQALKDGLEYCKKEGFVVPKGHKKPVVADLGFDETDPIQFPIYLLHDESESVVRAFNEKELDEYLAMGAIEISEDEFYDKLPKEDLGL